MSRSHLDNSSYWIDIYANGNTGVFWDVVDFPIPERDPDLISKKIKSVLNEDGRYKGPVSIRLYEDDEKTLTVSKQELIDKYEAAGISYNFVPQVAEAHGYARVHKMFVDILLWTLHNPQFSNLIILSKKLGDKLTVLYIRRLDQARYNVVLPKHVPPLLESLEQGPITESSDWLWDRLCESLSSSDGGEAHNKRKHADSDHVAHP